MTKETNIATAADKKARRERGRNRLLTRLYLRQCQPLRSEIALLCFATVRCVLDECERRNTDAETLI